MRIAILGNSGSGKSTLAKRLALRYHTSILDLDTIAWVAGEIAVPRPLSEAVEDVSLFCQSKSDWVIEGCYANLIAVTLEFNPILIFLDPGVAQCIANCQSRPWEPHKYSSKAEQDTKLEFLLAWVTEYYLRDGEMSYKVHEALFAGYTGTKHRLNKLPDENISILEVP